MSKLSYEDILNLYKERKNGKSITTLSSKYGICNTRIEYLTRLIDRHGFEILRKRKNKYYSPFQKEEIVINIPDSKFEYILTNAIHNNVEFMNNTLDNEKKLAKYKN